MEKLFKMISAALVVSALFASQTFAGEWDGYSYSIDKSGEIYSDFTKKGSWTESEFSGYDNSKVYVTNEAGASAVTSARPAQIGFKQEVFVWKSVLRNGDDNAEIVVSTNTETLKKKIDFSEGYSGWVRVGVVNLPDVFIMTTLTASGNGTLPVSAIKYIRTDDTEYIADRIFDKNDDLMVIKNNSEKCLYNHEKLYFEDAKPIIMNNRMMVPLRFVSENMGADVVWNGEARSVTIQKDGKTVVFYIDSTRYTVDGEEKFFEAAPIISNLRTMIPLRALSEGLDCSVDYFDGGLVLIGKTINYEESQKDNCINALCEVL